MSRLQGDKKQRFFFRIVSAGIFLSCILLLYDPSGEVIEETSTGEITEGAYTLSNTQADMITSAPEVYPSERDENENTDDLQKEAFSYDSLSTLEAVETISMGNEDIKVKGIYVTGPVAGSKKMDELIHLVETTKLNAMVIDIKNDSGEVTYKMDYELAKQIGATKNYISDIQSMIQKLKEKDIYLIARVVAFKDPILAEKIPAYSLKKKDGTIFRDSQGLAWVNPYQTDVWNYNYNIAKQAAILGFDEIQFDYIRFSTDGGMKDVTFGGKEATLSKADVITQFTKYITENLQPYGVKVSADVYGAIISSEADSKIVGQDYEDMSNHLDCICPMIYPSQFAKGSYGVSNPDSSPYDIIYRSLLDSKEKLAENQDITVRPWLQDFTATWLSPHITYDTEQIRAQIEAVYASGYEEWILWNASNHYSVEALQ